MQKTILLCTLLGLSVAGAYAQAVAGLDPAAVAGRLRDGQTVGITVGGNEHELGAIRGKLVAVTYGSAGAALFDDGREVARAAAPPADAVDTTGAGDAFTAALVVSLLEGRDREEALERAVAEGARSVAGVGAQWS